MSGQVRGDSEKEIIYKLIKERLKKQSFSMLTEMIQYVETSLIKDENFNRNKIEKLIKGLLQKKRILIGTQLTRDDILETPIRNDIFLFIQQNPGANINEIIRENNLGSNQALWHLKFLQKFEFIRSKSLQNQKAFFPSNIPSNLDLALFFLRNDKIKNLINFFTQNKELLSATAISDNLNMHYSTTKKYLEILEQLAVVEVHNNEGKTLYRLNEGRYKDLLTKTNELIKQDHV